MSCVQGGQGAKFQFSLSGGGKINAKRGNGMQQESLFANPGQTPLADRVRPRNLSEFVGQQHLVGPGKILQLIDKDQLSSMIFEAAGRQNHPGQDHCPADPGGVCYLQCGDVLD